MLLPLFPLKTVLFPGALLPLHVFEPRYRQLLADVTAGDRRFGLLPPGLAAEPPDRGAVGCVAAVKAVMPLPEGRATIVVGGERRFRLRELIPASTPYLQGRAEWLDDLLDVQVPTEQDLERLRDLGERYARALHRLADQTLDVQLPRPAAELSFEIASLLEWEFEARQRFLEIRSTTERVERLLHALPVLVDHAEERALVHTQSAQNGRGKIL